MVDIQPTPAEKTMTRSMMLASMMVLSAVTAVQLPAMAQNKPIGNADVPVSKVALYSSGVGYFEHAGKVAGNGTTTLRFKAEQVNDILKSLVLQDLDGGTVSTVSYPSQDPLGRSLKGFQVDLSAAPSMPGLLGQLRGAKVSVVVGGETVVGDVLGVETRKQAVGDNAFDAPYVNLITATGIKSLPIDSALSISFVDADLQAELNKALAAVAGARDKDKKNVAIDFRGNGDRRVKIGYVVESPIWKTSYRLVLNDDDKAHLQGWAIVENQTDSDWNEVQLSLVSGRPISFVMDLYQPLYLKRPTAHLEMFEGLQAQTYEGGRREESERQLARKARGALADFAVASPAPAAGNAFSMRAQEAAIDIAGSVASQASAGEIGELFEYVLPGINLPRQSSAMVPIVTDPIEAERISIYNADTLERHPLSGARLTNTTGKHLLQGPITVFNGGSYAGDAQINNVAPGQDRLVSFGIDLQTVVDSTNQTTQQDVQSVRIVKGFLEITSKSVHSQTYSIENKSDKTRKVVIEHDRYPGYELVDSPKPAETTDSVYRFETKLEAGKSTDIVARQQVVQGQTLAIIDIDLDTLLVHSNSGKVSDKARAALGKAIELRQKQTELERRANTIADEINVIGQEQTRIRENMKTVDRNSQYYGRLVTKLDQQETDIEKLQANRNAAMAEFVAVRAELETFLNNLNVD
jgi:hypothetical protein